MDLARLRTEVMSNPFYLNYLISEDAQVTAIIVETEAAVTEDAFRGGGFAGCI